MQMDRKDIHFIARHSNWSADGIKNTLNQEIYSNHNDWSKFLKVFFLSLGIGFSVIGIVFFFAYNWDDIHKLVKIGLIESMATGTIGILFFIKTKEIYKNIGLLAASILVGVLFAVYGQIYQTGANAYDFFLGWSVSISLWVVISNFAPLWLLFFVLVNTTYFFYMQQVANGWTDEFSLLLLFALNTFLLLCLLQGYRLIPALKPPKWLINIITLLVAYLSVLGICIGIFNGFDISLGVLISISLTLYLCGVIFSIQQQDIFYIGVVAFCILIVLTAYLIHISNAFGMFLFISIFMVTYVTLIVMKLLKLHRKWNH